MPLLYHAATVVRAASAAKTIIASALTLAFLAGTAAWAQAAPARATISEGMHVVDGKGANVGIVVKVQGDSMIVKTDKHEAALLQISITQASNGLLLGMTQQQLNEAVERRLAGLPAKLEPGATVTRSDGIPLGTITGSDFRYFSLRLASGQMIQIRHVSVSAGPNGGVLDEVTTGELKVLGVK